MAKTPQTEPTSPREPKPVVLWQRPRCPACDGVDLQTDRTNESTPDILSQYKRCRTCGETFIAIGE